MTRYFEVSKISRTVDGVTSPFAPKITPRSLKRAEILSAASFAQILYALRCVNTPKLSKNSTIFSTQICSKFPSKFESSKSSFLVFLAFRVLSLCCIYILRQAPQQRFWRDLTRKTPSAHVLSYAPPNPLLRHKQSSHLARMQPTNTDSLQLLNFRAH